MLPLRATGAVAGLHIAHQSGVNTRLKHRFWKAVAVCQAHVHANGIALCKLQTCFCKHMLTCLRMCSAPWRQDISRHGMTVGCRRAELHELIS